MGDFTDFAGRLLAIGRTEGDTGVFRDEEEAQKLCGDMHCSVSMALAVKQHIRYCELAGRLSGGCPGFVPGRKAALQDKKRGEALF